MFRKALQVFGLQRPGHFLAGLILASSLAGQNPPLPEDLAITPLNRAIVCDGKLEDWGPWKPTLQLGQAEQIADPAQRGTWRGPKDLSGEFQIAYDTNHLYLAGVVHDDQLDNSQTPTQGQQLDADAVELRLLPQHEEHDPANFLDEGYSIWLMPLNDNRPWAVFETKGPGLGQQRQGGSALTGFQVMAQRLPAGGLQFEAVLPFHHFPAVRPGCQRLGFDLVLHDHDPGKQGRHLSMSWTGKATGADAAATGTLRFLGEGPMVPHADNSSLLGRRLLVDLPFLLVPLLAVAALVLLLRFWSSVRVRVRWLRPVVFCVGVFLFLLGLLVPGLWLDLHASGLQRELGDVSDKLQKNIQLFESGTLASYRGASRDRALIDLLTGKPIQRQKYTSYQFLSEICPGDFGAPPRSFPDEDFKVRPYWLPLAKNRTETFTFDPPLHGESLYVVIGRSYVPPFVSREPGSPVLRFEQTALKHNNEPPATATVTFDRPFQSADTLGSDLLEVTWQAVELHGELRTLGITAEQGSDLRLVGIALLPSRTEAPRPLLLGSASIGGVLTDLRGPWPQEAGIELGPNATAKVSIPAGGCEPYSRLWLFYRAVYPGVPSANTGERVAEVVLHFRNGQPDRTITLEHQVSMFYELTSHNTRDAPPEDSSAAVAFAWVDDLKERHTNMVYPVLDLPPHADIEAIEFKNLAGYRMRFRSVVFGEEKASAPPNPENSPLVKIAPDKDALPPELLQQLLRETSVAVYREGRLSEATLPPERRQDVQTLPRAALEVASDKSVRTEETLPSGARRIVEYSALNGDGWEGAKMAVALTDEDWVATREGGNLLGLTLCLLASPILLILFNELLSVLQNLRLRLMAVLSVASLVPLALLSFVLVQVLEQGHENDLRDGMRDKVRSAMRQLTEQEGLLRVSSQRWLKDLAVLWKDRVGTAKDAELAAAVAQVPAVLQQLMASQLPPEWRGGFLKLELHAEASLGLQPQPIIAGDSRLAGAETPARPDPGVYLHWGSVLIGVRSEEAVPGGTLSLTVGRPLGADFLGALAPGFAVLLTDAKGYPLDYGASSDRLDPRVLFDQGRDPKVMAERERALFTAIEGRQPVVQRVTAGGEDWLSGAEVLKDLQDTPRALLVLAQPDQRARLDLPIGRIPVRAFFLLVAGLLLVLSAFLSFVVSTRISRPIERLEHGAQAIIRGDLETRVPTDEGGQIGRLTRTFNQMAQDLQGRWQDLHLLNRAIRDLSAHLDQEQAVATLRQFCEQHSPADRVAVLMLEPEAAFMEICDGPVPTRIELPRELQFLPRVGGAFSLRWNTDSALAQALGPALQGLRSAIGLPLSSAGRCRGAVLLMFEKEWPLVVNLDLLTTVAAQAAVALDNAQLYRHAVQDPVTGAFMPDYFRRRVAEEIGVAQQRGKPLVLLGLGLGDGSQRPRGLLRFAAVLREHLPASGVLCHVGAGQFQALVPGCDRPAGEALMGRLLEAWSAFVQLPSNTDTIDEHRPTGAIAVFPDEAASAEFLYEVLRDRLASGSAMESAAIEFDESLQRAGVTAVSPPMREVYRTLRRVAPTDLTILLEGETGTGKEVLTNLLHRWSKRANGPLVRVHCAALSETLLASELFGHEKGAFTGADRRKIGKFEQAHGGTIFLDEVGEIPLEVQVKLLRVLQEREIDRVGGAEPVPVDVRVIAATNRDIRDMVKSGRFREDLYYRLQGMVVFVPPLRERRQEIPGLVEHFRHEVVAAGQSRVKGFSTDAMDELFRRDWPGNVRELRNAVFRAMVLATGEQVTQHDLLAALPLSPRGESSPGAGGSPATSGATPLPVMVRPPQAAEEVGAAVEAPPVVVAADPGRREESSVVLPRPAVPVDLASLPERLQVLYQLAVGHGSIATQDHMVAQSISHRTSLRDLQQLVELGLLERVGRRRGARYRPIGLADSDGEKKAAGKETKTLDPETSS